MKVNPPYDRERFAEEDEAQRKADEERLKEIECDHRERQEAERETKG